MIALRERKSAGSVVGALTLTPPQREAAAWKRPGFPGLCSWGPYIPLFGAPRVLWGQGPMGTLGPGRRGGGGGGLRCAFSAGGGTSPSPRAPHPSGGPFLRMDLVLRPWLAELSLLFFLDLPGLGHRSLPHLLVLTGSPWTHAATLLHTMTKVKLRFVSPLRDTLHEDSDFLVTAFSAQQLFCERSKLLAPHQVTRQVVRRTFLWQLSPLKYWTSGHIRMRQTRSGCLLLDSWTSGHIRAHHDISGAVLLLDLRSHQSIS